MRGVQLPILGGLLLGIGVALGWFASRYTTAASGPTITSAAPRTPKFWSDQDAAKAIRSLGYEEAYVYRWQHGHVDGWVELEVDGGAKRVEFDTRRASLAEEDPNLPLEPGRVAGFVLVAMRKRPSEEWDEYDVRVEQHFDYDLSHGVRVGYAGVSQVGKIKRSPKRNVDGVRAPVTASAVANFSAELKKYAEGKSANWFELRLVEK